MEVVQFRGRSAKISALVIALSLLVSAVWGLMRTPPRKIADVTLGCGTPSISLYSVEDSGQRWSPRDGQSCSGTRLFYDNKEVVKSGMSIRVLLPFLGKIET